MNINTKNMSFVNFNSEEMQWVKFNGVTVYEAWRELIVGGVPPLTLLKSGGKNLVDYKIYGNSKQSVLPQEYQQVEYIENLYRQCIDTGVIPTDNTSIEITYQALMYETNSQYIAGSREGTSGTINYAINGAGGRTDWDIRFASSAIFSNVTRTDNVYKSTISLTEGNGNWNLTNLDTSESYDFPIVNKSINATTNLFLFGYNTTNIHSNLRIFECKIQEGTMLIRHFIPCYKKSNGVIGMYDLVNDVFYANATDNINPFTKGADILPTPEAPIEIESVGDKTKNVYDYTKALGELNEVSTNGITFKIVEDGILVNGTATASANSGRKYNLKPYLEAGKTYTASSIGTGVAPIFYSIENGTANWNRTKTITGNEDSIALYLQVASGVTVDNVLVKIQLEEGTTATEYEPYGYKIPVKVSNDKEETTTNIYLKEPLRKIGDYTDYIDFKNKKVVRNIKRLYADDTISYRSDMASRKEFDGEWAPFQINIALKDTNNAYSNKFVRKSSYYVPDYIFWLQTAKTYLTFNLKKSDIGATSESTNEEILELGKQYVANNPIYFDVVVEKIEETIELPNIPTHKGTTIIETDTNIQPSYMEVVYKGKGKLQLLDDENNEILNSILNTNTDTDLNITNTEINKLLDEIIGD